MKSGFRGARKQKFTKAEKFSVLFSIRTAIAISNTVSRNFARLTFKYRVAVAFVFIIFTNQ